MSPIVSGTPCRTLAPASNAFPVVRRRVPTQFAGDDELIVVHSSRFSGATTLLQAWLTDVSSTHATVAYVIDPAADISEDDYWARLLSLLPERPPPSGLDNGTSRTVFDAVLHALAAAATPVILVLDDLHVIANAISRVNQLFDHAPAAGLRIVATTRTVGEWPSHISRKPRWSFLHSDVLRFDVNDVTRLLRSAELDHDVRTPEIIHTLTDGLPSLVQTVCRTVPPSEIAAPEHLAEYIPETIDREVDAVIRADDALNAHRRAVLLSAAADPLTAGSAAVLVEQPLEQGEHPSDAVDHPRGLLDTLSHSGMAHPSGSPTELRWRYPAPVRASLLRLAESEFPDALRRYRLSLARHWLDHKRPDYALRAAGDAEDWELTVEILREHLVVLYSLGYPTTMSDEVIARIPPDLLADDPILGRLQSVHQNRALPRDTPANPDEPGTADPAVVAEGEDDWDEDDRDGDDWDRVRDRVGNDDDDERERTDTFIRAVELRVNARFEEAAQLCEPLAARATPDPDEMSTTDRNTHGFGLIHIAISFLLVGWFREAIPLLRRAHRTVLDPFLLRDAAGKLALIYTLLGDLYEARAWLAEERRHPALPAATEALVRPAGDVAAALLALERSDTDRAMDILVDLGSPADHEELWGFILYAGGQLALATGTANIGLRQIETDLPRFAAMRGNGSVMDALLDSVLADLYMECGHPETALELLAGSRHPTTAPSRARALLLTGDPAAALDVAREAKSDLRTPTRDALELDLVAAAAAHALGDTPLARRFATSATALRRMTELHRPFITLTETVRLLTDLDPAILPSTDSSEPTGAESFPAYPRMTPAVAPTHPTPPDEPLSERELSILRSLTTGATNREIADQDFVSINTVKTQVRAIYRKLGVASRSEAVTAARRLGII